MTTLTPHWLAWPETKELIATFAEQPFRFVGGCVRDAILGEETHDVDVTTPLLPTQVQTLFSNRQHKVIPTGIDHGTVMVVIGQRHFEITTLRRDVQTDGRHAEVRFTENYLEDAKRRDFTMNALYCTKDGIVEDYIDGLIDAKARNVRFIGDPRARIKEDSLRILRFFRFLARFGVKECDSDAIIACQELRESLRELSGERIQQEMFKLLLYPHAAASIELMQRHHVWHEIVPHEVNTEPLLKLARLQSLRDPVLALACLLRRIDDELITVIESLAGRWKLSRAHHRHLLALCNRCPFEREETQWKKQLRNLGSDLFIQQMLLLMAEGEDTSIGNQAIAFARGWSIPTFPVTGDDLLARGITPGKHIGSLLHTLEHAWEESGYRLSKEDLLSGL